MPTEVLRVSGKSPDPAAIRRAAEVLLAGGLVAFPTETVYGLGGLADDADAIARIYAAKGRPSNNPLIAHVRDETAAREIAGRWPAAASTLAKAFWPGPVTLVVPRGPTIPRSLTAGLEKMAIRVPNHPVALALLSAVERPIAAPSANPSMHLSPTRAEHVVKGLEGRVDLVLDAGPCEIGIESTVVDVSDDPPRVLRPGSLSIDDLARVVPAIVGAGHAVASGPRASPGLDARHYAPNARLLVLDREALHEVLRDADPMTAVITRGVACGHRFERTLPDDAAGYAAALFGTLHDLDDAGATTILLEAVPSDARWDGIRDRVARASVPR